MNEVTALLPFFFYQNYDRFKIIVFQSCHDVQSRS